MAEENKEVKEEKFEPVECPPFSCPFHTRVINQDAQKRHVEILVMVNCIDSDSIEIDKETLKTRPVLKQRNFDEETQTYKHQCGLEYFLSLVQQGRADPADSHDDGTHSVDMRAMPKTIHEAAKQADALSEAVAQLCKALGIKEGKAVTQDDLLEMVAASAQKAKEAPQPTEVPKE